MVEKRIDTYKKRRIENPGSPRLIPSHSLLLTRAYSLTHSLTSYLGCGVVIFVDEFLSAAFEVVEALLVGVDLGHKSLVLLQFVLQISCVREGQRGEREREKERGREREREKERERKREGEREGERERQKERGRER